LLDHFVPASFVMSEAVQSDDPSLWLASTPLLDLEDPKLRLRAHALTQLCRTDREKVLAVYGWVKRIPFGKPFKMRLHTAREVMEQGSADSNDKATLMVAMLRAAGIPARLHFVTLHGDTMRGLLVNAPDPTRPVVEAFHGGAWVCTDTYIFDAAYLSAARHRLDEMGWDVGFGIHRQGQMIWDGSSNAFVGGVSPHRDPLVVADHGWFCDPLEFVSSKNYRETHVRVARALQWHLRAPAMDHAIRDLRGAVKGA
jgi:hypothetical protein